MHYKVPYDSIEYSDSALVIRYSLFESNWKFTVGQQQPPDDRRANFNYGDILMTQLNIKAVNHGTTKADKNRYCGPSAISIITGMTTGEAARLIRSESGQTKVLGTHNHHLLKALSKCNVQCDWRLFGLKLHRRTGPTLAGWLKATVKERTANRVFLIIAGHHYQLVQGRRYVCGIVKEPVSIKSKRVRRRARVSHVWELRCDEKIIIPSQALKPKKIDHNARWRREAKKLMEEYGFIAQREHYPFTNCFWVAMPENAEDLAEDLNDDLSHETHVCDGWDQVYFRMQEMKQFMDKHFPN